jgi:outer membrane lipoprotein-sorting protein
VLDYDFGSGPKFPRVSPAALVDANAPLDPGPANSRSVGGDVTWRPMDALRTSLEASRNVLVRDDNGLTAYDATLVSWRTAYQFTRFAFIRLRTDWDSARATLRGQYLFGWTPSPGTAIYAGYNDVSTIDGFDPQTGALIPGFTRNGRTVFVKLSCLLRTVL